LPTSRARGAFPPSRLSTYLERHYDAHEFANENELQEEPKKSADFSRVDELGTVNLKCRLNDFPLLMSIWRKAWIRDFRCEVRAGGAHA